MPDISTLKFDLTDCSPQKQEPQERTWMNPAGVMHKLQFTPGPGDWWPFDLTNVAAARDFYGKECSEFGGAVLSLDVMKVAGAEALRGVFKHRSPLPDHLGMYFAGIL